MALSFDPDGWQIVFFSEFDATHMPWLSAEIRIPEDLGAAGIDSLILRSVPNGITVAVGFGPTGWRLPDPERPGAWSAFFEIEGERANRLATGALANLVSRRFLPACSYRCVHTLAHRDGVTWATAPHPEG